MIHIYNDTTGTKRLGAVGSASDSCIMTVMFNKFPCYKNGQHQS